MSDYSFWQRALAGEKVGSPALPIHDGAPQPGFYRTRPGKDRQPEPVAIFEHDGKLVAVRSTRMVDASEVWTWCARDPITEEVYRAVAERGEPWPDDAPAAPAVAEPEGARGIGDNQPRDPWEQLAAEIEGEAELVAEFLRRPIDNEDAAAKVAVWSKRLTALRDRAVESHKAEKAPILEQGKAIDAKWFAPRDHAADLVAKLKAHLTPWLQRKKREEEERRREAEAAAQRKREEAEQERRLAEGTLNTEAMQRADAAAAEAARLDQAARARPVNAGRTGSRVSLRTEKRARIVDFEAALLALKENPEVRELVERLANKVIRAGGTLPGVEIMTVEKAA